MTVLLAGPAADIGQDARQEMVATARSRLAATVPVTVTLSRVFYHPEAIVLGVSPASALSPVFDAAQAATCDVTGSSGDTSAWRPHLTLCYSTSGQPAAPIIAALGKSLPPCEVTIDTLSLVVQNGPELLWDWQRAGDARLLGAHRHSQALWPGEGKAHLRERHMLLPVGFGLGEGNRKIDRHLQFPEQLLAALQDRMPGFHNAAEPTRLRASQVHHPKTANLERDALGGLPVARDGQARSRRRRDVKAGVVDHRLWPREKASFAALARALCSSSVSRGANAARMPGSRNDFCQPSSRRARCALASSSAASAARYTDTAASSRANERALGLGQRTSPGPLRPGTRASAARSLPGPVPARARTRASTWRACSPGKIRVASAIRRARG